MQFCSYQQSQILSLDPTNAVVDISAYLKEGKNIIGVIVPAGGASSVWYPITSCMEARMIGIVSITRYMTIDR